MCVYIYIYIYIYRERGHISAVSCAASCAAPCLTAAGIVCTIIKMEDLSTGTSCSSGVYRPSKDMVEAGWSKLHTN